jgi:MFS transporter, MHS family, proline/betaine transporter
MKSIKKRRNKATIAAMIGTALEYYDMSLYGFMAPLLVSIFLPTFDTLNALLITFIFTPISIIVRPLGALVIGKIGDKYGRRKGLAISIGGMALATGLIGLLPTYQQIGFLAPVLFIILRSLQGFFVAGEYNGGAIFVLEHTEGNKGLLSGIYCMYTVVGILAAAATATFVSYLPNAYWRLPYLIGFITGIVGLYIRKHIKESPKFLKYKHVDNISLKDIAKKYKLILILIGVSSFFSALYVLPTILMNSLLPLATPYKLPTIMSVNAAATVVYMLTLPIFGHVADKLSFNKSMSIAGGILFIASYPLISLISYQKLEYIILMKMCFAVITAWFVSPFHAWAQSLFHTKERYTAISFSYSIGSQLGGFMVPLSLWAWKQTHSLSAIYYILMFWAIIALIALYFERRAEKHD